jgi:hypothetical protein
MALALHPFVIGQPFRLKYLEQALAYITEREGVWVTTSDEIAEHFLRSRESLMSRVRSERSDNRGT